MCCCSMSCCPISLLLNVFVAQCLIAQCLIAQHLCHPMSSTSFCLMSCCPTSSCLTSLLPNVLLPNALFLHVLLPNVAQDNRVLLQQDNSFMVLFFCRTKSQPQIFGPKFNLKSIKDPASIFRPTLSFKLTIKRKRFWHVLHILHISQHMHQLGIKYLTQYGESQKKEYFTIRLSVRGGRGKNISD